MPITKSAKKALRQSFRRRARNITRKEAYKTLIKQIKRLAPSDPQKARDLFPRLYKALDKAAKTKAIDKNKASRLKSRLSAFLNRLTENK